jgi:hypothetical protein
MHQLIIMVALTATAGPFGGRSTTYGGCQGGSCATAVAYRPTYSRPATYTYPSHYAPTPAPVAAPQAAPAPAPAMTYYAPAPLAAAAPAPARLAYRYPAAW